jgi:WD40 repeat protein
VAVSPDGSLFATSPAPGRVTIWRRSDQTVLGVLRGPCGYVDELEWSQDGRLLGAACDRRMVVLWDVHARKIERLLGPTAPGGTSGLAFSRDGRLVATAGVEGSMRVYDLTSGRMIGKPGIGHQTIQAVDFSADGKWLVGAGLGSDLLVWNVAERRIEHVIHHGSGLLAIKFAPEGREFATGDFAGNVDFWDAATGRHVGRTLGGQNGLVLSVTYDPSGTHVVTTSTDGKLRLWDLASGKLVGGPLPGADTAGWGTFFPDGKRVIAVFDSGTGVVWNVDPAAWKATACRVAHRRLTRAEWRDFVPERSYRPVCP